MTQRKAIYRIEYFDDYHGFIKLDAKKNLEDAETICDVYSKSRKQWFRVVANGKVLNEWDGRKK